MRCFAHNRPRHTKYFLVNSLGRHTRFEACVCCGFDHRAGAADVHLIDGLWIDQARNQLCDLLAVNSPVGNRCFLHLAAQRMNQLKARQVPIPQVFNLLAKNNVLDATIAEHQRHA